MLPPWLISRIFPSLRDKINIVVWQMQRCQVNNLQSSFIVMMPFVAGLGLERVAMKKGEYKWKPVRA